LGHSVVDASPLKNQALCIITIHNNTKICKQLGGQFLDMGMFAEINTVNSSAVLHCDYTNI